MKTKDLINKCLPGRNGIDDLFLLNLILIIILLIIDLFFNDIYLSLSLLLAIIILIYRIASRNIKARKRENKIYLNIINYPKNKLKLYYDIILNYNRALYKRCPKCKQIIKLPLKKGTHDVICPTCKNKFKVKCNRNEKIKVEIVKNH